MGHILVVAEKPSVARDVARALGVKGKGDGCLKGESYVVTWALGHLVRLAEPDELDTADKKWSLERLPIVPQKWELKPISKTRSQLAAVKRLMRDREIDSLVCATDAGREGELIFRWIYELTGCKKPFARLWISSMTDTAIREGMANLHPGSEYDALFESALCRARADWLIGMNLSRAFTVKYGSLFSVGRVQTPTLALLVKRQKEIEAFIPETTFGVEIDFGDYKGVYTEKGKEKLFSQKADAEKIVAAVRGKIGVVSESNREPFTENPPLLYDLTSLQREANKRFGLTAKRTLSVAQSLYEKHKYLTYPRTESRFLTFDLKPKVRDTLSQLPAPFAVYAQEAVHGLDVMKNGRLFRSELGADHHALIPTERKIDLSKLGTEERKVMELVLARFTAAFMPPAQGEKRRMVTIVAGMAFFSQSSQILDSGWKVVDSLPEKSRSLPILTHGDERVVRGCTAKEHISQPPKPYTDASLLYAMEHAGRLVEDEAIAEAMKKHGLGTPATRAAILERLMDVGYAQRKGKTILPTEKGKRFIELTPETLSSAELTGKWEYALNVIAEQKAVDAVFIERFMTGVTQLTGEMVRAVKADTRESGLPKEDSVGKSRRRTAQKTIDAVCPLCGKGRVTENERFFGCSRWKQDCCFTLWKDALVRRGGPALNAKIVKLLLLEGQVRGSTGVIVLSDGQLYFQFTNSPDMTPRISIAYHK